MKRFIFLTAVFSVFLLLPSEVHAQKKFKDSFRLIWVKSLGNSTKQKGTLNYNVPIRFTGDFPMLNKKYDASTYTYVYYVVKSADPAIKMFSLYQGDNLHSFYTDSIKSVTTKPIDLGLLSKGAMVNFNFYNKDFKKNDKGILYLENVVNSKSELFEVLVCSNCSTLKLKDQIQTYLAVKYGITLAQKDKYIASDERKVWDEKLDKTYNNRIHGIARDDYFGLNQEASYSNTDDAFVVAKSKVQVAPSTDLTYVLLGDNNGEKIFDVKSGLYKRRWLVQNTGEVDLKVDLSWDITPNRELEYFLYNSQSTEINNDLNDTLQLSFKDIEIKKNNHYYFTLEQRKPLKFDIYKDDNGLNSKYILGINEVGEGPFYITAKDIVTQQEHFFVSDKSQFNLENLPSAAYAFSVTDVQGKQAELANVILDMTSTSLVSLASEWELEGTKMIQIKPSSTIGILDKTLSYGWYFDDKLISEASSLYVNYPGAFNLEITDRKGKKEHFSFDVRANHGQEKTVTSQWLVSPNPVDRGEEFTVTYQFDKPKKVDFYIYTIDGKFILRKELGMVENNSFTYRLMGATTYLIVPVINSKAEIQKLIVK